MADGTFLRSYRKSIVVILFIYFLDAAFTVFLLFVKREDTLGGVISITLVA
jgi:hypothetical protein